MEARKNDINQQLNEMAVAREILAFKIAECTKKVRNGEQQYREELKKLREQRDKVYSGDQETIKEIIENSRKQQLNNRNIVNRDEER